MSRRRREEREISVIFVIWDTQWVRAGVELWEKPFQSCRSSRATELRQVFPEYLVNRWLGYTQKVAEAYYTQVLANDFIAAYHAEKTVGESDGKGLYTVEMVLSRTTDPTTFSPDISSTCNVIPLNAKTYENDVNSRVGSPPIFASACKLRACNNSQKSYTIIYTNSSVIPRNWRYHRTSKDAYSLPFPLVLTAALSTNAFKSCTEYRRNSFLIFSISPASLVSPVAASQVS